MPISIFGLVAVGLFGRDIGPGYQLLYAAVTLASACTGALIGVLPAAVLRRGEG